MHMFKALGVNQHKMGFNQQESMSWGTKVDIR